MKIKWLRPALQDLLSHAEYIAHEDQVAAGKEFLRVESAVQRLKDDPLLGRPSAIPGLRELVVAGTPFLVPYRVKGDRIEILAVFHGAQDWESRLKHRKDTSQ